MCAARARTCILRLIIVSVRTVVLQNNDTTYLCIIFTYIIINLHLATYYITMLLIHNNFLQIIPSL